MNSRITPIIVCLFFFSILLTSCVSSRGFNAHGEFITSKLEMKVPLGEEFQGADKINGVVRMYKSDFIRISFRAPVVRSEMFVIEYTKSQLVLVNRMNKMYSVVPIDELESLQQRGIHLLSFEEMESLFKQAVLSRSSRRLTSHQLGLDVLPASKIELSKFSNAVFKSDSLKIPNRYVQVDVLEFYDNLFKN